MHSIALIHGFTLLVIAVAWIAFWILALVSIFRRPNVGAFERGVWTVVVIVLPFLGPLAWFIWGRTRLRAAEPQA